MASIRKRGERWQARVNRKGYAPEVKTFTTYQDAEKWVRAIESEMDKGGFISRTEAERTTFSEILDRYIAEVSPTHRGYKEESIRLGAIKRHKIASLSLANISPKTMAAYRDERLETCNPATVVRDLAALSAIFNHCRREWGYAISNPIESIKKPAMPPGRDRVLSLEEEAILLDAMTPIRNRNIYIKPLTIVAIETAMRRGEMLKMKWQDIDFNNRTVFLQLTKNGTARTVPLSTKAINTLKAMPRNLDGRVFPINEAAMEYCFKRACRRAGIHNLHFHDLRHTATTRLAEKLPNIIELASVTGHKNVQMLARYYHPKAEDLAKKIG